MSGVRWSHRVTSWGFSGATVWLHGGFGGATEGLMMPTGDRLVDNRQQTLSLTAQRGGTFAGTK